MADIEAIKRRKRQSWDEIDPESEEALSDIPGVQHDEVSGAIMEAPVMIASGAGKIGANVLNAAQNEARKGVLSKVRERMPPPSGVNSELAKAHPQVRQQALANPDRLGKEGKKFIEELEQRRVGMTEGNALASIGAKARDQRVKVKSNPKPEERTLTYGKFGQDPQWK